MSSLSDLSGPTLTPLPFRAKSITFCMRPAVELAYDNYVIGPGGTRRKVEQSVIAIDDDYPLHARILELVKMYHTLAGDVGPTKQKLQLAEEELIRVKGELQRSEKRVEELQLRMKRNGGK